MSRDLQSATTSGVINVSSVRGAVAGYHRRSERRRASVWRLSDGQDISAAIRRLDLGARRYAAPIRTWRATANGMEGVAAECCDGFLPLDEMGMVDAREAGEIVYSLANGTGKARAGRDGSARARRTWRVIFESTGEVPLAVKMGERGTAPMAGQDVRLANIPADAGKGFGVFQELHGMGSGAAFSVHLQKQTTTHYGTVERRGLSSACRFVPGGL